MGCAVSFSAPRARSDGCFRVICFPAAAMGCVSVGGGGGVEACVTGAAKRREHTHDARGGLRYKAKLRLLQWACQWARIPSRRYYVYCRWVDSAPRWVGPSPARRGGDAEGLEIARSPPRTDVWRRRDRTLILPRGCVFSTGGFRVP
jgi:hypothetical protein